MQTMRVAEQKAKILFAAIIEGSSAKVRRALVKGANPNYRGPAGKTPLHLAAAKGTIEIMHQLLRAGADINAQSANGSTPLHVASEFHQEGSMRFLVSHGASREIENLAGNTPGVTFLNSLVGAEEMPSAPSIRDPNLHWINEQIRAVGSVYTTMFEANSRQYSSYIKASQCGVVRYDPENPLPGGGLCTDGLSMCVAIILINQHTGRISLTHTDLAVQAESIVKECHWVGDNAVMHIIRGAEYDTPRSPEHYLMAGTIPRLQEAIEVAQLHIAIHIDDRIATSGAVAISTRGELFIPESVGSGFLRIGIAPMLIELRHAMNMLQAYLLQNKQQYHSLDIQSYGDGWTGMPTDFCEEVYCLIKSGENTQNENINHELVECRRWFDWCKKNFMRIYNKGITLNAQGEYGGAAYMFDITLQLSRVVLRHPGRIAQCALNLGLVYFKEEKSFKSAKIYLEQAYQWYREYRGADDSKTIQAKEKLDLIQAMGVLHHMDDIEAMKMINIPQGKSGRLSKRSLSLGIDSLYTSGFSTCVIIACIGIEHITLMHHDRISTPKYIKDEIDNISRKEEFFEVLLIFREAGKSLVKEMLPYFRGYIPGVKPILKMISSEHDGIRLSFEENLSNPIHSRITTYPLGIDPGDLLRHPEEQKLLTVQKMEQVIGLQERQNGRTPPYKQYCVFDEYLWTAFSAAELTIDVSGRDTREEMDFLRGGSTFVDICGRVGGIMERSKIQLQDDMKNIMAEIGKHAESYMADYDHVLLFRRNMIDVINADPPQSRSDHQYKRRLLSALAKSGDSFEAVTQIIAEYDSQSEPTTFKTNLIGEYQGFASHYRARKLYSDLTENRRSRCEEALLMSNQAIALYKQQDYTAALEQFFRALKIFTQNSTDHRLIEKTRLSIEACEAQDPQYGTLAAQQGVFAVSNERGSTPDFDITLALSGRHV